MPETLKSSGQEKSPLVADAPNSVKREERIPSDGRVRWKKKTTINKPEEFVEDADLKR